jgi:hypothetical protein
MLIAAISNSGFMIFGQGDDKRLYAVNEQDFDYWMFQCSFTDNEYDKVYFEDTPENVGILKFIYDILTSEKIYYLNIDINTNNEIYNVIKNAFHLTVKKELMKRKSLSLKIEPIE